jgi:REP element-mobilizing transposase RayT
MARRFPLHVTASMRRGLPPLRRAQEWKVLRETFRSLRGREGFRLVHFVVLSDHLHFVVEAEDREVLARSMQSLLIRVAKRLNQLWGRRGRVLADRYHDRVLRTPREVRNVLGYVLKNASKHGAAHRAHLDTRSSAPWFDGWRERRAGCEPLTPDSPVSAARTWLLSTGWRRHGLIPLAYTSGAT